MIDLMSLLPGEVLFVFQIGNLLLEPVRLMTFRGALSMTDTDVPGMLLRLRSSMYKNCPVFTLPTPGN